MIEQQIADLNDGKLPFGVFLVPTSQAAGLLGFGGKYHLLFAPEGLHWVVLKGSLLKNDIRFQKVRATVPWERFKRFRYEHVSTRNGAYWALTVEAEGLKFSWREYGFRHEAATESQQYVDLGKACFFYKNATPDVMKAWWDDAMKGATGDRDARDYLYLMDRHFKPQATSQHG